MEAAALLPIRIIIIVHLNVFYRAFSIIFRHFSFSYLESKIV